MTNGLIHTVYWLRHAGQRLGLVPSLGGGVAAWTLERPDGALDLLRPWDGKNTDRYSLASFPMVPWSNRIGGGGFTQNGNHYPIALNRTGEPYPIHGDGWLQLWTLRQPAADALEMALESDCFDGNPYQYSALQRFVLRDNGMDQTLSVTHRGKQALPYGLGQHPWFMRTPQTRLQANVKGVWLSGKDPMPLAHSPRFPPSWDLPNGLNVNGTLVDNAFTGWNGSAQIHWPEHQLQLEMRVPELLERSTPDGFCLLYRPPQGPAFCFEPVSHPIDAFNLADQPGVRVLQPGETLTLHVEWRLGRLY